MVINLDQPRYDQATYWGRAKHFILLTNPLNAFATDDQLNEAQKIVQTFRKTNKIPAGYDEEKLWAAKYLYDSAFHPDTGEKMLRIGRMSAQAPMNTLITGCMISFYKSNTAIVFWQWFNQTFNAIVNYSNRAGDAVITKKSGSKPDPKQEKALEEADRQLLASYCAACGGALGTALYLNSKVKGMNPLYARLVPFAAVCGANFINIPMMRSTELMQGTPVFTPDGQRVGNSKIAAATGIFLVCISRVGMAMPGMTLVPIITNTAVQKRWFKPGSKAIIPFQLALVCMCVTFATPLCCAFFEQKANISVDTVETSIKGKITYWCDPKYKLYARLVPFAAVTVAHLVGIPTFKSKELKNGTPVFTPNGKEVGNSQNAAALGVVMLIISRVAMAAPPMILVPRISHALVERCWFRGGTSNKIVPFQILMVGLLTMISTPLSYAMFKQKPDMDINYIEAPLKEKALKLSPKTNTVYFNKGL